MLVQLIIRHAMMLLSYLFSPIMLNTHSSWSRRRHWISLVFSKSAPLSKRPVMPASSYEMRTKTFSCEDCRSDNAVVPVLEPRITCISTPLGP